MSRSRKHHHTDKRKERKRESTYYNSQEITEEEGESSLISDSEIQEGQSPPKKHSLTESTTLNIISTLSNVEKSSEKIFTDVTHEVRAFTKKFKTLRESPGEPSSQQKVSPRVFKTSPGEIKDQSEDPLNTTPKSRRRKKESPDVSPRPNPAHISGSSKSSEALSSIKQSGSDLLAKISPTSLRRSNTEQHPVVPIVLCNQKSSETLLHFNQLDRLKNQSCFNQSATPIKKEHTPIKKERRKKKDESSPVSGADSSADSDKYDECFSEAVNAIVEYKQNRGKDNTGIFSCVYNFFYNRISLLGAQRADIYESLLKNKFNRSSHPALSRLLSVYALLAANDGPTLQKYVSGIKNPNMPTQKFQSIEEARIYFGSEIKTYTNNLFQNEKENNQAYIQIEKILDNLVAFANSGANATDEKMNEIIESLNTAGCLNADTSLGIVM